MTNSEQLKALEAQAQFHKSLAEPVRLRILALLGIRESLCVCDLVSVLNLTQSTVSRHLAYLKNQGLVASWREGTWIHYSIASSHTNYEILHQSLMQLETLEMIKTDRTALESYEQSPRQCSI